MSDEEGFLNRWSRRKLAEEPDPTPPPEPEVDDPQLPERSDAEILAELGLKDPEELLPGDDISGFMAKAVPVHLRNRALRKLWRSNPVLACLDGLNDYDDDFTGDTVPTGALKTLYKVGRGILKEVPDPAEEPHEAEGHEQEPDEVTEPDEIMQVSEADDTSEEPRAPEAQPIGVEEEFPALAAKRRIRVSFDDAT